MYLYLYFNDGHCERHFVVKVSDLSRVKSRFLYFETPNDAEGKGTCIERDKLICFVVSRYRVANYDKHCEV